MPPPPQMVPSGDGQPTIFSKLKMGATMGGLVGLTIGFLFGGFAILRNGAGPRGFLPSLSGYMLTSAATFAFFMSIGTVIRTDGLTMREWAELEIKAGRGNLIGMGSSGVSDGGNGAIVREWERRRKEIEKSI